VAAVAAPRAELVQITFANVQVQDPGVTESTPGKLGLAWP